MSTARPDDAVRSTQRRIRVVSILDAAERAGLTPLPLLQLHTIAYFADALAPVWGLRILDAQLLKRREGPMSPLLQRDVDSLVGSGVVTASSVRYVLDDEGGWRLDAMYSTNPEFALRILNAAAAFEEHAKQLNFVQEVVFSISALGPEVIYDATASDAAYGDSLIDIGGLLDIASAGSLMNQTARIAVRFGELMHPNVDLSNAEMVHLYVRELYKRIARVA